MAVEGRKKKKAAPAAPPRTHYIFGFLTLPTSTRLSQALPLVVSLHLLLQRRGAGHRRRRPPDGYEALHFCNHRQLVPSDYTPLNAVLSAVAPSNTERD